MNLTELKHKIFGHKWYWKEKSVGYRPRKRQGDYLPDKVTVHKCRCGAEKRIWKPFL